MDILDKISAYQELIIDQTEELPEYYVIDNEYDFERLKSWLLRQDFHKDYRSLIRLKAGLGDASVITILGSKLIIDIIKEK